VYPRTAASCDAVRPCLSRTCMCFTANARTRIHLWAGHSSRQGMRHSSSKWCELERCLKRKLQFSKLNWKLHDGKQADRRQRGTASTQAGFSLRAQATHKHSSTRSSAPAHLNPPTHPQSHSPPDPVPRTWAYPPNTHTHAHAHSTAKHAGAAAARACATAVLP
jgi:hypothetical protein